MVHRPCLILYPSAIYSAFYRLLQYHHLIRHLAHSKWAFDSSSAMIHHPILDGSTINFIVGGNTSTSSFFSTGEIVSEDTFWDPFP